MLGALKKPCGGHLRKAFYVSRLSQFGSFPAELLAVFVPH
jgi:hypothetical protein